MNKSIGNDALLLDYVLACNGLRSAESAAQGFVSGKRIDAVKAARSNKERQLAKLSDWVEVQARQALNPPGSNPARTPCSPDVPS